MYCTLHGHNFAVSKPEHEPNCMACQGQITRSDDDDDVESGKDFSDTCAACLFKTHLQCRPMPTVIKYSDTKEHLLTIYLLLAPTMLANKLYRCVACGGSGRYNMYLCKPCGLAYHYECVKWPRRLEHEHGLHYHHVAPVHERGGGGLLMPGVPGETESGALVLLL
ncbi:hypothetical protein V2J09_020127 [Rumex salicifolius]